ncbi:MULTISPECIES: hypothetical protein [unclassified Tolypothrix]|uniref:hypothetical protein n=2 Tax=Tolypothrix TaxID=111782 RepID=UPI0007C53F6D|nr:MULTISPECIES: hypothetical protein [unclassified Tolypothrix]UYD25566.1 hypothetical protein HGR01_30170 [Tolypothrix sp. PCC 7712]UYD32191.1 hypothetical protein HG267_24370 [Tolypothrix sp. PCC 7601]
MGTGDWGLGKQRKQRKQRKQGRNNLLPITNYQLPITNYQLPITNYQLPITPCPNNKKPTALNIKTVGKYCVPY